MISGNLMKRLAALIQGLALILSSQSVLAATWPVSGAGSALAVLTGKEGLASGLAHRHIIVARNMRGQVVIENLPGSRLPSSGSAQIEFAVSEMAVDQLDEAAKIIPVFEGHQSWHSKSDKLEPSNSEKVRGNMLDTDQLDAAKFPLIKGSGSFSGCKPEQAGRARCDLDLTITIKGVSVARKTSLEIDQASDGLVAVFHLPMKFSDFGITPYSAMMGAIKVSNEIAIAGKIAVRPNGGAP